MPTRYMCLNPACGHQWTRNMEGRARQCPSCWTAEIIRSVDYDAMVSIAVAMGENPGPLIDALMAIVEVQGLTMRPLRTLALIKRIVEDARARRKTPSTDASVERA